MWLYAIAPAAMACTISPASVCAAVCESTKTRLRRTVSGSNSHILAVNEPTELMCTPGRSHSPAKSGCSLLVAVQITSAASTAARTLRSGAISMPSFAPISRANSASCAPVRVTSRQRRIGRTAHTASSWPRACGPAPKSVTTAASSRAKYFVATPLTAPVRMAVTCSASINANGWPVGGSYSRSSPWMAGKPKRAGFSPYTATTFTAAAPGSPPTTHGIVR